MSCRSASVSWPSDCCCCFSRGIAAHLRGYEAAGFQARPLLKVKGGDVWDDLSRASRDGQGRPARDGVTPEAGM